MFRWISYLAQTVNRLYSLPPMARLFANCFYLRPVPIKHRLGQTAVQEVYLFRL